MLILRKVNVPQFLQLVDAMTRIIVRCLLLLSCVVWVGSATAKAKELTSGELDFFEKKVRPLLAEHCYECHSVNAKRIEASLLLDSRKAHLTGGDSGPSLVPGDVDGSLIVEAVRYESYEMPPKGKLPDDDIQTIERWVEMGAPWPDEPEPSADGVVEEFDLEKRKSEFWVWQPVQDPLDAGSDGFRLAAG